MAQTEGFWQEFFLLRPDRTSLRRILDELGPEELLEREDETRELFARAIAAMKRGSKGIADIHALEVRFVDFLSTSDSGCHYMTFAPWFWNQSTDEKGGCCVLDSLHLLYSGRCQKVHEPYVRHYRCSGGA